MKDFLCFFFLYQKRDLYSLSLKISHIPLPPGVLKDALCRPVTMQAQEIHYNVNMVQWEYQNQAEGDGP